MNVQYRSNNAYDTLVLVNAAGAAIGTIEVNDQRFDGEGRPVSSTYAEAVAAGKDAAAWDWAEPVDANPASFGEMIRSADLD